jgi:hypothetical protein
MGEMTEQDREMLQYLMGVGSTMPEQKEIERQRVMLDHLRQQTQTPQGAYTKTGAGTPNIYVQPHALQNLAALVGQGVAGYGENRLNKRSTEIGQGNVKDFKAMVERLRSGNASANMGSTGRTITMDQGDYGGSL